MKPVLFKTNKKERVLIRKIVDRAAKLLSLQNEQKLITIEMDITAAHCNGNPLDLKKLLGFNDENFLHDVAGIFRHIDRESGALMNFFSPRSSKQKTPKKKEV